MSTNDTGTSDSPKGQKKLQSRKVNDDIEKKGATISGGKPNPINLNPVSEQAEQTAVTNLNMRAQPVHKGHVKVIKAVEAEAKRVGGSAHIVTSHSESDEKNPIPTSKKVGYLKKVASKGTHVSSTSKEAPSLLHTAARLNRHAHHLVVVAGSDRAKEYETLLNKYNGKEGPHGHYNFKSITVKSIGRDPDAEGTEGISGTKMREHARNGNISGFKSGLPPELHQHAEEMMNDINKAGKKKVKEDVDCIFGQTFIDTDDTVSVLEAIDAAHREAIPRSGDRKKIQFVARKDQDRKKSAVPYRQNAIQTNVNEAGLPNTSNYTPSMFKDKSTSTSKLPNTKDYNPSMFNKSTSTTKLPNTKDYTPSMFKNEAKKPKSGWDRIWNPETIPGRKMIAASDEAQKAADALKAAAKQKTNEAFEKLDEISKELVGQVNKKRTLMNKPSKTKKASEVLQRAVDRAGGVKVKKEEVESVAEEKHGLWYNIWKRRKSGKRMRKPGEKGAPTAAALKAAQEEFDYQIDEAAESGLAAKAKKSGVSLSTLRKVYNRGMAAWNSGHRPGTTPQQWAMARVNSYIAKGKGTYGGADKDLHEDEDLDENYAEKNKKYHAGLSKSTAKARVTHWKKMDKLSDRDPHAYEPAPGDATAKTKPSKYTKMYHKKYGK
jgi:hypothetical protein